MRGETRVAESALIKFGKLLATYSTLKVHLLFVEGKSERGEVGGGEKTHNETSTTVSFKYEREDNDPAPMVFIVVLVHEAAMRTLFLQHGISRESSELYSFFVPVLSLFCQKIANIIDHGTHIALVVRMKCQFPSSFRS